MGITTCKKRHYTLLPFQENSQESFTKERNESEARSVTECPKNNRFSLCLLASILSFISGVILTILTLHSNVDTSIPLGPLHGVPPQSILLTYNASFGANPSPASNALWKSLAPPQGGFFRHPSLAPNRSGMTVFHQLHCLDVLRHGIYAPTRLETGAKAFEPRAEAHGHEHDMEVGGDHVYHCIDYLRQTIMCAADTNLEPRVDELGGVSGFGSVHSCRDFGYVREFVGRWEAWNQTKATSNETETNQG